MADYVKLSSREEEVLKLLAQGLSTKQIAQKLYLAESTIVSHRETTKKKLNATNCTNLIFIAVKRGYI